MLKIELVKKKKKKTRVSKKKIKLVQKQRNFELQLPNDNIPYTIPLYTIEHTTTIDYFGLFC
jgi:hypothetical protein